MKCSLILLTLGYVEESYVSTLIFKARPFATGIEGLHHLASGLMSVYHDEVVGPNTTSACCQAFLKTREDPGQRFCPTCRTPVDTQWDVETWKSWLHELGSRLSHEWPHELEYVCEWNPWPSAEDIFSTPKDEILVIPEHGEDTLTKALKGDEVDDPGYAAMIKESWGWYTKRANELGRKGYDRAAFARDLDLSSNEDGWRMFRLSL